MNWRKMFSMMSKGKRSGFVREAKLFFLQLKPNPRRTIALLIPASNYRRGKINQNRVVILKYFHLPSRHLDLHIVCDAGKIVFPVGCLPPCLKVKSN